MSIHYLIDPFTNNGDIVDVTTAENGQTDSTGSTVIRIPDGVAIHDNPSNLADLITAKYDGLLASYAGFQEIVADPCLDVLTADLPFCDRVLTSGGFVNHCVLPGGSFISVAIPLAFAPTQAVVLWEEYEFVDSDDKASRMRRTYSEASGASLFCAVSFQGGGALNTATNGNVLNIPLANQGSSFVIGLANVSGTRKYIGSWAVIY